MLQYFDTLTDDSGNSLLGATVTVTNYPAGTLASIFNTNGTISPVANSTVVADITGQISFWAPDGAYTLSYNYKGTPYKTRTPVQMIDPMGFVPIADTGAANAYVITDQRLPTQLYVGLKVTMIAQVSATGASTFNMNGTGTVALVQPGGAALVTGNINATGLYVLEYDGTRWQVLGAPATTGGSIGQTLFPQTTQEAAASVTPSNFSFPTLAVLDGIVRYGADPTGVADSQPALAAASSVGQPFSITAGTYLVNSNITIAPNVVFLPGAILKPAAGVTITLTKPHSAGIYKIFDLSLGGLVLPSAAISDVYADWWGAQAIPSGVVNNEVPINQAWYALLNTASGSGVYGGRVRLPRGAYLTSGTTYSSDNISYQGEGYFYTVLKANSGTWSGANLHQSQNAVPITFTDNAGLGPSSGATSATLAAAWALPTTTYPVVFFERAGAACEQRTVTLTSGLTTATWSGGLGANCTAQGVALTYTAIFNNTISDMRLSAGDFATGPTACIYAPAWQQQSGARECYISDFRTFGILIDNGYGGAAQLTLERNQFLASPSAVAGAACLRINNIPGTVGLTTFRLKEQSFNCAGALVTFTAGVALGATSATLLSSWQFPSGVWNVFFVETVGGAIERRDVTLTNGLTTATWAGALGANCNATANAYSPNCSGVSVTNTRAILDCDDVHFEQLQNGFDLSNYSLVVGQSIKSDGSSTVRNLFRMESGWSGYVNATGVEQGGAIQFISDAQHSGIVGLANYAPPLNGNLIWPPSPAVCIGAADVAVSGGVASYNYSTGVFSGTAPNRTGAGVCVMTLSPTMDGIGAYDVVATSQDSGHPQIAITKSSGTAFTVNQFTPAGAAGDATEFSLKVYRKQT